MNQSLRRFGPSQSVASPRGEQGVVLIICLVLLAVVTILGLSTMGGTSLELKMASSFRDRGVAFEAAEESLRVAETWIEETNLNQDDFVDGCTGANCFNVNCDNGLCAFYDPADPFTSSLKPSQCGEKLNVQEVSAWQWSTETGYANVWNSKKSGTKSVEVSLSNSEATEGRYIIEFQCYANKSTFDICATSEDFCMPQFRITALGRGATADAIVMLQSTYKKTN